MTNQRSVIKQIPAAHARFMLVGRCGGGNLRLNSVVRPKTRSNYLLSVILPRAVSPVKRTLQQAPDIALVFELDGSLSHPFIERGMRTNEPQTLAPASLRLPDHLTVTSSL